MIVSLSLKSSRLLMDFDADDFYDSFYRFTSYLTDLGYSLGLAESSGSNLD
jgi:hypothetical protein